MLDSESTIPTVDKEHICFYVMKQGNLMKKATFITFFDGGLHPEVSLTIPAK